MTPAPIPYLTRAQVRAIDRIAVERYAMPSIVLMENAARAAADLIGTDTRPGDNVLILCGGGNNGGDGLAIARHLHNRGLRARIALTVDPAKYTGDALVNLRIVQAMRLPIDQIGAAADIADSKLIVDAIFGTGLTRLPRDPFGLLADQINRSGVDVVAIDIPSGLDCDSGKPFGPCIAATQTITFAAMKRGYAKPESRQWTGRVTVGDIGCPRELIIDAADFVELAQDNPS